MDAFVERFDESPWPMVVCSVRQSDALERAAGRHPQRQAAQYLARAFRRLRVDHAVWHDLPPAAVTAVADGGTRKRQLDEYRGVLDDALVVAKDANLLLTNRPGGGKAEASGTVGVAGASTLDADYPLREHVTDDDPRSCVFGVLHEFGHMLSQPPYGRHGETWGVTWADHDRERWFRTPRGNADGDAVNLCGRECEPMPDGYEERKVLGFAWCARENLLVE